AKGKKYGAFRSSKFQAPSSREIPITKLQTYQAANLAHAAIGAWSLKFLWSLELGIWSFVAPNCISADVSTLSRIRIRPQDFYETAFLVQELDRFGNLAVFHMAVAIDEEEIFPGFALARARFDLRQVNAIPAERRQRMVQRAHFIRDTHHQTRA